MNIVILQCSMLCNAILIPMEWHIDFVAKHTLQIIITFTIAHIPLSHSCGSWW